MSGPRLRRWVIAIGLLVFAATGPAGQVGSGERQPNPEVLGQSVASNLTGEGSCDVDGVAVSYDTAYQATPAPAGYRVTKARVDGIAGTCAAAQLEVTLLDGTVELASATTLVGASSSTANVTFTTPPSAEDVDGVAVELAGGAVPVPQPCRSMRLDLVRVGTTGPDTIAGTNQRDLVFGLNADDRLDGGNQNDCLDGGPGNDTLDGGTNDDVVLGGDGNDSLHGSEGKDDVRGGAGDDVLTGGPGNDRLDGGDGTDRCSGGQGTNQLISCEVVVP